MVNAYVAVIRELASSNDQETFVPVTWRCAYGAYASRAAARCAFVEPGPVGSTATEKNVPPLSDELTVPPETVQDEPVGANAA